MDKYTQTMILIKELCNEYDNEDFEVSTSFDGAHFYIEYVDFSGDVEEHAFDADLLEALEKFKKTMELRDPDFEDDEDEDEEDEDEDN